MCILCGMDKVRLSLNITRMSINFNICKLLATVFVHGQLNVMERMQFYPALHGSWLSGCTSQCIVIAASVGTPSCGVIFA